MLWSISNLCSLRGRRYMWVAYSRIDYNIYGETINGMYFMGIEQSKKPSPALISFNMVIYLSLNYNYNEFWTAGVLFALDKCAYMTILKTHYFHGNVSWICWYAWSNMTATMNNQGAVSIRKTVLPGMAIPMLKIRRPNGRLIFNMEIAIRR